MLRAPFWVRGCGLAARPAVARRANDRVAGLAADAIVRTQLAEPEQFPLIVFQKTQTFLHGCRLAPGHGAFPPMPDSALDCYPCSRSNVLPMYPVYTFVRPNKSLQRTRLRRAVTGRSLSQAFGLAAFLGYHRRAAERNR